MAKEVKQWITIKGRHIPIFKGETVKDAAKRMAEKGRGHQPISKEEKQKSIAKTKKEKDKADKAYEEKQTAFNAERKIAANEHHEKAKNQPEMKGYKFHKNKGSYVGSELSREQKIKNIMQGTKQAMEKAEKNGASSNELAAMVELQNRSIQAVNKESLAGNKEDFVVDYKIPDKVPGPKKPSASAKRKQAIKQMIKANGGIENIGTPTSPEEAKKMLTEYKNEVKEKTWQDKDAEVKAKQIENTEKQRLERNDIMREGGGKKRGWYANSDERDDFEDATSEDNTPKISLKDSERMASIRQSIERANSEIASLNEKLVARRHDGGTSSEHAAQRKYWRNQIKLLKEEYNMIESKYKKK